MATVSDQADQSADSGETIWIELFSESAILCASIHLLNPSRLDHRLNSCLESSAVTVVIRVVFQAATERSRIFKGSTRALPARNEFLWVLESLASRAPRRCSTASKRASEEPTERETELHVGRSIEG